MNRLESSLKNMIFSLGLITLIAGAILGTVYFITKQPIAEMQHQMQVDAIKEVVPEFDNDPEADKWEYTADGSHCIVYPAYRNSTLVGAAVESMSMNGFAGEIRIMCGFDTAGNVIGYKVLSHGETPGLGSKMQPWFSDTTAQRNIIGKSPATTAFYVTKDTEQHGKIDAITAATISSRAFLEAVRKAFDAYTEYINTTISKQTNANNNE